MKKETYRDLAEALQAVPLDDERIGRFTKLFEQANATVRAAAADLPIGAQPTDYLVVLNRERGGRK